MTNSLGPVSNAYLDVIAGQLESDLGRPLAPGTTIVPAPARAGSQTVVGYFLPELTALWCDPEISARLAPLASTSVTGQEEFARHCTALGGEYVGAGNNRVAEDLVAAPATTLDGTQPRWLDRDATADVALIGGFLDGVSRDDADEAELDLGALDPAILALVDTEGPTDVIAAYASARPWAEGANFDDIAVIVHPDHRQRQLGTRVVALFCQERQRSGHQMLYRCDVENKGSNALAQALGFTFVHSVFALRFST